MSKQTIYLDNSTTAADMVKRRDAVRAISEVTGLRFIATLHNPKPGRVRRDNLLSEPSVIEPAPVHHKTINEVV